MHNVNTEALKRTIAEARRDPAGARQDVALEGKWQTQEGAPQFRGTIGFPEGEASSRPTSPRRWAEAARRRTRSPTASGAASPAMR